MKKLLLTFSSIALMAGCNVKQAEDVPAIIHTCATIWGQNIRDEEAARLTKVDVHSLGKNRVNATLRNIQTFYDAFGITDGAMFLPEEERVIIW